MVAAGELEAGDNFEEEGDEEEIDIDMEDEESKEEEIMERKNYGGGKGNESKDKGAYAKKKEGHGRGPLKKDSAEAEGKTDYRKKLEEKEVEEMRNQIAELASTLSEVKLLNAKLLYTNKIFRAKNLTESQKVKVLEAFDKAASVKDAKLIYETLTTIKETKSPVTESMRGMASKAAGMAPTKKPILEVNDQFARWQILAGIKK
jgi:hypothetical protein